MYRQLHFANPQAYLDIYNNKNKWDKEESLYHSFNEDETSFGYLNYRQAKERRDVLLRLFARKEIGQAEGLIVEKVRNSLQSSILGCSYDFTPHTLIEAVFCFHISP